MKNLFILLLLFPVFIQAQNIYAEFYSLSNKRVYLTDNVELILFDNNAEVINADDTTVTLSAGFIIKLHFVGYTDSLRTVYNNNFYLWDEGIVRLRIWDTKLYGYCYVNELNSTFDVVNVTLYGMKNVPQRKKLLFKDSPKLRMWKYPWVGN